MGSRIIDELTEIETKLVLLAGADDAFYVEDAGFLKQYTLREIRLYGYSKYMQHINILCLELKDLESIIGKEVLYELKQIEKNEGVKLTIYDLITNFKDSDLFNELLEALKFIFKSDIAYFDSDSLCIYLRETKDEDSEERIIHRNNFPQIQKIISYQHLIKDVDEEKKYNPVSEKAKEIMDKLKKSKEEISKIKNKESKNIDFASIVSAVSTKSVHYNKHTIWDLTIYQLYDEYIRLNLIDKYDIDIRTILAGGDSKKINVVHWSSSKTNN